MNTDLCFCGCLECIRNAVSQFVATLGVVHAGIVPSFYRCTDHKSMWWKYCYPAISSAQWKLKLSFFSKNKLKCVLRIIWLMLSHLIVFLSLYWLVNNRDGRHERMLTLACQGSWGEPSLVWNIDLPCGGWLKVYKETTPVTKQEYAGNKKKFNVGWFIKSVFRVLL